MTTMPRVLRTALLDSVVVLLRAFDLFFDWATAALERLLTPTLTGDPAQGELRITTSLWGERRLACTVRDGQVWISGLELVRSAKDFGPIQSRGGCAGCTLSDWRSGIARIHLERLISHGEARFVEPYRWLGSALRFLLAGSVLAGIAFLL